MSIPHGATIDQIQELGEMNSGYEFQSDITVGIAMAKTFAECLVRRKWYPVEMTEGGSGRGTGHSSIWSESWIESELQRVRNWLSLHDSLPQTPGQLKTQGIFGPRRANLTSRMCD